MATTRILVVDDEEDLCEILKFNLEIEGYEVDTAYSAEEALKKDLTVYNLLLLDVMMGEISGFKMARILRQDEKTANTLSSSSRPKIRRTICSQGSISGRMTISPSLSPSAK